MAGPFPPFAPVTPAQAAQNADILASAISEHDAGIPEALPPAEVDFSGGAGLTPDVRAAVMLTAKQRVLDIAAAVRSRNAHQVQRLTGDLDRAQLAAVVLILAEAADPGRLLIVTQTSDDGCPAHLVPDGPGRARAVRDGREGATGPARAAAASTAPSGTVPADTEEAENAA
jgi:hypothetical protein